MFETLKNAFKVKEIRRKIFITIGFILLYRVGCFVPVPGIAADAFRSTIQGNDFLGIMSAVSGGSLSQGTLFAMGIGPYINASIIIQLLCIGIPALERLSTMPLISSFRKGVRLWITTRLGISENELWNKSLIVNPSRYASSSDR